MPTHFNPEALKFLRNLARNNDRLWFDPRKPIYERELKAPMLALIEEINHALATISPAHIRPPHKVMMRIYRDTRFDISRGHEVRPYKKHIAAWWSHEKMLKTSGAGYYISISPQAVTIAAGCYMPAPEQLLAIRRHLVERHAEFRKLLTNKKLRAALSELEGHRLTRPPRGFPADSPALDLILARQWGLSATLPAEAATKPTLLKEITTRFALAAPIIDFLNTPILHNTPKITQF